MQGGGDVHGVGKGAGGAPHRPPQLVHPRHLPQSHQRHRLVVAGGEQNLPQRTIEAEALPGRRRQRDVVGGLAGDQADQAHRSRRSLGGMDHFSHRLLLHENGPPPAASTRPMNTAARPVRTARYDRPVAAITPE